MNETGHFHTHTQHNINKYNYSINVGQVEKVQEKGSHYEYQRKKN